jgi:hypothetical protein
LPLDARAGYSGPLLSISSASWVVNDTAPLLEAVLRASSGASKTCIVVEGTRHHNFNDVSLFFKMMAKKFGAIGSLDIRRGLDIVNAFDLAFFEQHLKATPDAMAHLVQGHKEAPPEVLFQGFENKRQSSERVRD